MAGEWLRLWETGRNRTGPPTQEAVRQLQVEAVNGVPGEVSGGLRL